MREQKPMIAVAGASPVMRRTIASATALRFIVEDRTAASVPVDGRAREKIPVEVRNKARLQLRHLPRTAGRLIFGPLTLRLDGGADVRSSSPPSSGSEAPIIDACRMSSGS